MARATFLLVVRPMTQEEAEAISATQAAKGGSRGNSGKALPFTLKGAQAWLVCVCIPALPGGLGRPTYRGLPTPLPPSPRPPSSSGRRVISYSDILHYIRNLQTLQIFPRAATPDQDHREGGKLYSRPGPADRSQGGPGAAGVAGGGKNGKRGRGEESP